MWGGGSWQKIKICDGGSEKFSIPPPLRISNGIPLNKDLDIIDILNSKGNVIKTEHEKFWQQVKKLFFK